jgi:hypothetical protein
MSRHQVNASSSIIVSEITIVVLIFLLIMINPEVTRARIPLDANRGQGLMSTRWNGLNFVVIILLL